MIFSSKKSWRDAVKRRVEAEMAAVGVHHPGLTPAETVELEQLMRSLHLPGKTGAMVKRAKQLLGKLK